MSMRPLPAPEVPESTARVARAAFPRGLCRSKIRFGGARCGDAVRSGGVVVLVDQVAQDGLSPDPVGLEVGDGGRGGRFGAVRGQLLPGPSVPAPPPLRTVRLQRRQGSRPPRSRSRQHRIGPVARSPRPDEPVGGS
jgi:hypothetical protein